MSLEEKKKVAGMEQAKADANIQYGISLLHPSLVKLIHSNPITAKKMGKRKPDFSQSLQAIIEDWILFFPTESKFAAFQTYFSRAKKVRHWVAHQSFDRNRYQHYMECLANVATAVGKPDLAEIILNLVAVKDDEKKKQRESVSKEEGNQINEASLKEDKWTSLKQEGNLLYKQERWEEAMDCYTRAIHLNQAEAVLYSNRALCEFNLSKFDLAREDIEDAIQLDPKNVKYFRVLSEALLQMKLHKESLEACLQGLEINPRDEVLILRERDCRALNASDNAAKNSVFGQSTLGASLEQRKEEYAKMQRLIMSLHLTSEDIEDCPSQDKLRKIFQITKPVDEAQLLDYEGMSSSTKKSQEKKAFKVFEAAAKKGSAQGLYNMALFYDEGKGGLPRDFHKAMELCRKAARQKAFYRFKEKMLPNLGVAEAECFLGICYSCGQGVDQCSTKAFEWYLIGARHGNATAQNNLGSALLNGDGCQKNETSARSWFQKAAEQGLSVGQKNYAMVLKKGLGGPTDAKKAAELLKLAADQGDAGSLELLQKLSMSGALGGSAVERTKENLKKAAKKADPGSLFLLGQNYQNGTGGFEKDLIQAEQHLREACKAGYSEANLPLGKLLLELKKNEEAFEFIKLAAEKGCDKGQFELGFLYAYGHGCDRDEGKARRWFNRAKQQGLLLTFNFPKRGETSEDDWTWVDRQIDLGKEISEFETQQQLKPKGISIEERKRRFVSSQFDGKDPSTPDYLELLEIGLRNGKSSDTLIVRSMNDITLECINELSSRAKNGSATAQSFFNACEMVEKAMDLLKQHQSTDAFKLVRFSLREWDRPIVLYSDFYSECFEAAKQALDQNSQDADALYVLAYFDTTQSIEEKLQMAKRCVELDPSVPDFHQLLSSMFGYVGDHRNALRALDRAIELLPNHPSWLYCRAGFIRLRQQEVSTVKNIYTPDVAEAYLTFLSSNPMDHRMFPDACYFLAHIYAISNDRVKAKTYYQKGLDAEDPGVRLPCSDSAEDDFLAKKTTRMLLNAWEGTTLFLKKNVENKLKHVFLFATVAEKLMPAPPPPH